MNSPALLKIENLKAYFLGDEIVHAVENVSLDVNPGEIVGIVGESGSGKSTVALSITGLLPPAGKIMAGEILFKGRNLLNLRESEMEEIRGKEISMVFQNPSTFLDPVMRIGDQIAEAIVRHKGRQAGTRNEVLRVLQDVRIKSPQEVMKYYPHQLSGGMKQRVLIATAISCKPALIVADEPTTALDVTTQARILELLKSFIKGDTNLSLLLITHDIGVVAEICDRVYVMYAGQVVEQADVFSLFSIPKHPYTIALLASAEILSDPNRKAEGISGVVPDLTRPPSGCRFHPRCPYAMLICKTREPPPVSTQNSTVYCWLYADIGS